MKRLLMILAFIMVAAGARADTLFLYGTSADVPEAGMSAWMESAAGPCHAVILTNGKAKEQRAARQALSDLGIDDVFEPGFPSVKQGNDTWMTDDRVARLASLIRRKEIDRLVVFSRSEQTHAFLLRLAQRLAEAAADPSVRYKQQKTDEYVRTITEIVDGHTGRTDVPEIREDWKARWKEETPGAWPFTGETDEQGFLAEGQKPEVIEHPDAGVWGYLSEGLRIVITKHTGKNLSWFEADTPRRLHPDAR